MEIYTVIRKGELHPVFCEDFFLNQEIGSEFHLAAVFDGCSSGEDAHFASVLLAKILRKIAKNLLYEENDLSGYTSASLGKIILEKFFQELKSIRNLLYMDTIELLATMLLLIYDLKKKEAWIIALGDGFLAIDGKIIEIDQDNRPDYPAYHMAEDFETWFAGQRHIFSQKKPQDISLASDGIDTFQSLRANPDEAPDPIHYLLLDDSHSQFPNMLNRKCNILEKKYGLQPGDDLSIVRIRF